MKRNVKIGIAVAIFFVVGMAYRGRVNARFGRGVAGGLLVGNAIANRDSDDRDDNNNAGRVLGTAAVIGTAEAIADAAQDDRNGRSDRNYDNERRRGRWNR